MAFTAIDSDTSWQDLAIAEELANSYNLRRSLCGRSTVSAPTQDDEVFDFVQALQNGIEEMADDLWINNGSALSTYEEQSSYPTTMSLAQAMTAAGLTASGYWRRISEGGAQPSTWTNYSAAGWSYGNITDKDLAGPWLFKDLQLALSALTRAKLTHTQYREKYGTQSYSGASMPSYSLSFASWTTGTKAPYYLVIKRKDYFGTVEHVAATFSIVDFRFDVSASLSAYESGRLMLTIPSSRTHPYFDYDSYSNNAGKMDYDNLTASDISTVLGKTVGNSSSASTSGGITSYSGIIAEDAENLIPLYNEIIPDSNVSADDEIFMALDFTAPVLIIDFAFE